MDKKKQPISYKCVEGTGYFAENCTKEEAIELILAEIPDSEDDDFQEIHNVTIDKLEQVVMRKCLDCETFWVDEDDTCGDCGENRLSKRFHYAWYLQYP